MAKEHGKLPERLTNENFMKPSSHFEVNRQYVDRLWPLHWHEFYEMEFVLSGRGTHIVNGITYPIVRGSLCLLTPADFHEVLPDHGVDLDLVNVKFSDEMLVWELRELLFTGKTPFITIIHEQIFQEVEADFKRLLSETCKPGVGSRLVVQGTLDRILIDLIRSSDESHFPVYEESVIHKKNNIQKSLIYIQHHFKEPLSLEVVARQSNLSVNYFSECFHNTTGFSFKSYVTRLRLQFALSLLNSSTLPVTEICFAAGFNSLPNFLRAFKKRFGKSPQAYRKNHAG